jgi:hypothetical protein
MPLQMKTSAVIYSSLSVLFSSLGLEMSKIQVLCCDGDSTLMGNVSGLLARLRDVHRKTILAIHCMAHRTALLMSSAAKSVQVKEIDKVLVKVYSLFNRSSKRQGQWEKFAKSKGITRLKFPIFNTTRWFSRCDCLSVLLANGPLLVCFITLVTKSPAPRWGAGEAVKAMLLSYNIVASMHILLEVLTPVNALNVVFQKRDILPHELVAHVEQCKSKLISLRDGHAFHSADTASGRFFRSMEKHGMWRVKVNSNPPKAVGLHLQGEDDELHDAEAFGVELIDILLKGIDTRFPDVQMDILRAFCIFDPKHYRGAVDKYADFDLLKILIKAFCGTSAGKDALLDGKAEFQNCRQQFFALHDHMHHEVKVTPRLGFKEFWQSIQEDDQYLLAFHLMLPFAQLMAIICGDSSEVERGFSVLTHIKSAKRNRLQASTIDSLMRVCLLASKDRVSLNKFDYSTASEFYEKACGNFEGFKIQRMYQALVQQDIPDPELAGAEKFDAEEFEFDKEDGLEVLSSSSDEDEDDDFQIVHYLQEILMECLTG